jgi:hypothetical protein
MVIGGEKNIKIIKKYYIYKRRLGKFTFMSQPIKVDFLNYLLGCLPFF